MVSMEGEWVDGAVAASLTTSTGCKIVWEVCLGERFGTESWADYKASDKRRIDVAYTSDKRPVTLEQDGATWTVDLNAKIQVNDETGTAMT